MQSILSRAVAAITAWQRFSLRPHRLSSRPGSGRKRCPSTASSSASTPAGPFLKDRLYWFVNYEQNNQDGAVATQIGGFPQFSGTWPLPFDERMAMGRADWNLTRNSRLFFRFTHNFNDGVASG